MTVKQESKVMSPTFVAALVIIGSIVMLPTVSHAAACANGVYRAGCVGPNGAAVVKKAPVNRGVSCASGPYRAGCAGPNGAAVARRPY
jgi:hypothetical protein